MLIEAVSGIGSTGPSLSTHSPRSSSLEAGHIMGSLASGWVQPMGSPSRRWGSRRVRLVY